VPGSPETRKLRVVVISDGKPGHENQSLGIAERLPDADILLLRHQARKGVSEVLLRLQIMLWSGGRAETIRLLKQVFPEAEIMRLLDHKPAAIIAAGTLSAAPCLLAGRLSGAKTCICMRPSMIALSRFDLAVLPAHDNPGNEPNVLTTLAAPNRVSPGMLDDEADKWKPELPADERPVLSWIVGGPSSSAKFDEEHVSRGLISALEWAGEERWQVWLSTARRTPETLEQRIAELPAQHPALTWSLLWHRDQRNPLYAMFHLSRVAVVTSDSVSMIAEAASAGKGPVVYQASDAVSKRKSKQDRMVDRLLEAGYGMRATGPGELAMTLGLIEKQNQQFPMLDDTAKAASRLLAIIRK